MRRSMHVFALAVAVMWAVSHTFAASASGGSSDARVVHVVLIWLKEPGNQQHRNTIIEATRGFSKLPGVEQVRVGPPIPSERTSVDDSFDVGLYMIFGSTSDLDSYLQNPEHKEAQRSILGPLVEKVLVYDFHDDRY